tara:strand:+ start:67 stop:258 length:192 start_codon:yes stop_codon:yes gene_type:complete
MRKRTFDDYGRHGLTEIDWANFYLAKLSGQNSDNPEVVWGHVWLHWVRGEVDINDACDTKQIS